MIEKMQKGSKLKIAEILQLALNVSLVILSIVLCVLLGREVVHLIYLAFFEDDKIAHFDLFESILAFFLYFEFIAMIVKYFQEDYHFPLRYFLYIGITAMVRLIVVDHNDPVETFYFSGAVLVLVVSFFILNLQSIIRQKFEKNEE